MSPSAAHIAALLIGRVSAIPTITETIIPMKNGWSSVAHMMALPTALAAFPIPGAHHIASRMPAVMVTKGVTMISIFVSFETSLPSSDAKMVTISTARGPPAPPRVFVAAPTAGASGVLPAVLVMCSEKHGFTDRDLVNGLFTAGAVGVIIARNASISGAEGGCQAEIGSASAMAAAALAELCGASPAASLSDPVAGLVECPCIKRNAMGAANAVLAADMALAGISSIIPFDEVVGAMRSVGRLMNVDLRETARGGLAATATALEITKNISMENED